MTKSEMNFNGTVLTYYKALAPLKYLNNDEEKECIHLAKKGDKKARNKLIEAHLKYVFKIASRYRDKGLTMQELISEGNYGLIKSISRFDENRNIKFATYAMFWIRQAISDAISRLKSHSFQEVDWMDFADGKRENAQTQFQRGQSYNTDKQILQDETIGKLLDKLNDKERKVIEMYYGINGNDEHTLVAVSKEFGVSSERVRQIKKTAIMKMRTEALMDNEQTKDDLL